MWCHSLALRQNSQNPEVQGWRLMMVGRGGTQVSTHHLLTAPQGRPRRDRAVSYRKSRWAVPSVAHCLPARGPSVPPPAPFPYPPAHTHTQVQRQGRPRSPSCSGGTQGRGPGVGWGARGRMSAPIWVLKGGERAFSRIQSPPLCSLPTWGSGWERSQPEDTAPAPSQRAELAKEL